MATTQLSRRSFLTALGLGVASIGLAGCGGNNSNSAATTTASDEVKLVSDGKLTMISNFYFPPFVFMNSDSNADDTSTYQGFDVDLYKAIAEKLKLEPTILPTVQFDTIVPTIKQGGKADCSIGAITITDEREQQVAMSDPYLDSNQSLVVLAGGAYDKTQDTSDTDTVVATLNAEGIQIAVQSGTTGEAWAKENLPKATVVPLDDIIQCFTGVQTGLYAASCCDLPVSGYEIKVGYSQLKIALEIPTGEQYGIAVSKDNPALLKAINNALKELAEDGTSADLQKKWFGTVVSE